MNNLPFWLDEQFLRSQKFAVGHPEWVARRLVLVMIVSLAACCTSAIVPDLRSYVSFWGHVTIGLLFLSVTASLLGSCILSVLRSQNTPSEKP